MPLSANSTKKKTIQKKKLHVVWFVDTTKTNTFSIAQWILWALAGFVLLCIGILVFSISLSTKQAVQIKSQEKYIQELKANVIELYLKTSENESPIQDSATTEPEPLNPPPTQNTNHPIPAATPNHEPKTQEPSLLAFEDFSLETSASGKNSKASVMLVNKKSNKTLSGFTCAVFFLKNGAVLSTPTQELRTGNTCTKGIPVKFSKIRPTTFEADTDTSLVKSVEIQFHPIGGFATQKNTFQIGN
jgi:hypothetical protein